VLTNLYVAEAFGKQIERLWTVDDFLQLHNSLPNTMILRSSRQKLIVLLSILVFSNSSLYVHSQSEFDCHITINDAKFDLTSLAGAHIVNRTRSTPPTTMVDSLRFDLCADLKQVDGLAEHDQVRLTRRIREPGI